MGKKITRTLIVFFVIFLLGCVKKTINNELNTGFSLYQNPQVTNLYEEIPYVDNLSLLKPGGHLPPRPVYKNPKYANKTIIAIYGEMILFYSGVIHNSTVRAITSLTIYNKTNHFLYFRETARNNDNYNLLDNLVDNYQGVSPASEREAIGMASSTLINYNNCGYRCILPNTKARMVISLLCKVNSEHFNYICFQVADAYSNILSGKILNQNGWDPAINKDVSEPRDYVVYCQILNNWGGIGLNPTSTKYTFTGLTFDKYGNCGTEQTNPVEWNALGNIGGHLSPYPLVFDKTITITKK